MIDDFILFRPNFRTPFHYRRRWYNTVMVSLNQKEQRSAHFSKPLRSLMFSVLVNDRRDVVRLKKRLFKNMHKIWGVPFWQDQTFLISDASANQKKLFLDTRFRNFDEGGFCVVVSRDEQRYEIGQIENLSDEEIILKNNLENSWDRGSSVYPLLIGRIDNEQIHTFPTTGFVEYEIEIHEEYNEERRFADPDISDGFPIFKNHYVFVPSWDWSNSIEFRYIHPYERMVFFGRSISISHLFETEFLLKGSFLEFRRQNLWRTISFFDNMKGRLNNFWFPSFNEDLKIVEPFEADESEIVVDDEEYEEVWKDAEAGRYLTVEFPDQDRIFLEVDDVENRVLRLTNSIGKSCSEKDLPKLKTSFLYFGRFNQDEIEIEYYSNEIARFVLSFRTCFNKFEDVLS